MRHIGFACAVFALGIFATPSAAQQTTPDQPPVEQKLPPAVPPAPPPERQSTTESAPPPFPPMSRHAPHHRFVDMGRHSTHHRATGSRRASTTHRAASATRHAHGKAARAHQEQARVSKKTERKCLKLSVKQALRNSDCKSLMRQQLQEEHHRATRSAKARHKVAIHRKHRTAEKQATKHSRKKRHKTSD